VSVYLLLIDIGGGGGVGISQPGISR